jgi:hypothetical protein
MARRKTAKKTPAPKSTEMHTESKSTKKKSVEPTPVFSEGFFKGAVLVLSILVLISAYMVGYKFGQLSQVDWNPLEKSPTTATAPAPAQAAQPSVPTPPEVPKQATPDVELFIMSLCPYGLQMQKAYIQAAELLEGEANMKVKWVHYLMHGEKELIENTRQYCVQEEAPDKYNAYTRCFVADTNKGEACLDEVGIDKAAIESCYDTAIEEFGIQDAFNDEASFLSERFPIYPVDKEAAEAYGVRGSPTMVINGKNVQVSRSPEAVKQAICNAFTDAPAACDTVLSANQEAPGAGPVGAGGGAAAAAAGCGG